MNQLLVLFIFIPFVAFLVSLFWQNKSEKAIGKIVRFTKVLYILVSVSFAVWRPRGGWVRRIELGDRWSANVS